MKWMQGEQMNRRTKLGIGLIIVGLIFILQYWLIKRDIEVLGTYVSVSAGNFPLSLLGYAVLGAGLWLVNPAYRRWSEKRYKERHQKEIKEPDVMVVTSDNIPGKKIAKTLGTVQARNRWPLMDPVLAEIEARKNFMKEALKLGGNAIIGTKTESESRKASFMKESGIICSMYGTAVIVEDEKRATVGAESIRQAEQADYCTNCGARVSGDSIYCTACGHKVGG